MENDEIDWNWIALLASLVATAAIVVRQKPRVKVVVPRLEDFEEGSNPGVHVAPPSRITE